MGRFGGTICFGELKWGCFTCVTGNPMQTHESSGNWANLSVSSPGAGSVPSEWACQTGKPAISLPLVRLTTANVV